MTFPPCGTGTVTPALRDAAVELLRCAADAEDTDGLSSSFRYACRELAVPWPVERLARLAGAYTCGDGTARSWQLEAAWRLESELWPSPGRTMDGMTRSRTWRSILVDGIVYRWRYGRGTVEIRQKRRVVCRAPANVLRGNTPDDFERGQHKVAKRGVLHLLTFMAVARKLTRDRRASVRCSRH